ncbi:MAG TPA: hypothetical protein VGH50_05320 [Candidatus Binatia bacterium]|jgi:hypothetical protein
MSGGTAGDLLNNGTTMVMAPGNGYDVAGSGFEPLGVPVSAGTLANLRVTVSPAPGGAETIDVDVVVNGAGSGIGCTITGASTTCTDLVNTFSASDGDLVTVEAASSAGATDAKVVFSLTHSVP